MTTTVRTAFLEVTFAGNVLTDVLNARGQLTADGGWPTCSVYVTQKPAVGNEEDDITVVAGAGNNVVRFTGVVREFRASGFPKALELVCAGTLGYAAEWAPDEVLELGDLFEAEDTDIATDQDIVRRILDQVPNVTYSSGDIDGTGIILGDWANEAFDWKAGMTAWNQIEQLDRATCYRTYQDASGTIRRVQMVGHPDGTPAFTLGDADALDGATGTRNTRQTRNNVRVEGYDYGKGEGPVTAVRTADPIPGTPDRWEVFSSNLIESGELEDGTPDGRDGLQAGDIADLVAADVNKEFVSASVPTWRDDTAAPAMTIMLDLLNRLAIGEPMWVAGYSWEVSDDGWTATFSLTGGGLPPEARRHPS